MAKAEDTLKPQNHIFCRQSLTAIMPQIVRAANILIQALPI